MAWFGNDVGGHMAQSIINGTGGHMAQSIINGTDKIIREPRKEYVYIVYDDIHGKLGIYAHEANAIDRIWDEMCGVYEMDRSNPYPYDYDGDNRRGWNGAVWYEREEVIQ